MHKALTLLILAAIGLGMAASTAAAAADNETARLLASDAAVGREFGNQVAISGTIALVGDSHDSPNGFYSGSVYVFDVSVPSFPLELTKMLPSDGGAYDRFGHAMAISGTIAVVGAPWGGTNGSGVAYVFDLSIPSAPVQLAKLLASDGSAFDSFGGAVAIQGTTVIVGAIGDDDNGKNAGAAYIFDISDPTAPVENKLLASDGTTIDWFGSAVAVNGALALVGAPIDDFFGSNFGSAYLFDISDPSNPVETKLIGSNVGTSDQFGFSVALNGTTALVGAPLQGVSQDARGAVYVYDLSSPSVPVEITDLTAGLDGQHLDQFGSSIAIDGSTVLIGAWRDDDVGKCTGSAYVFDISDPFAPAVAKLLPSGTKKLDAPGQEFGVSVAIDGGTMIIGAPLFGALGNKDIGAAYIFAGGGFERWIPCAITYCTVSGGPFNSQARMSVSHCDMAFGITVNLIGAPPGQFCYLLIGDGGGQITDPPGALGDLCLGGGTLLSRYSLDAGAITTAGGFSTDIGNSLSGGPGYGIPSSGGQVIQPGDSWNFQYWHRRPAGQLAGFSEALRVTF
jgi:hypothetical protein